MMFRNFELFGVDVDILDQWKVDDIINSWAKYHLSYDWCKFIWIEDTVWVDWNDQWYYPTISVLNISIPTWQSGWFATVWQEPTWPTVIYTWDSVSSSWVYQWPVGSYLGLVDVVDTDYLGKSWYVPTVNWTEDWLVFNNWILPPETPVTVSSNWQTIFTLTEEVNHPAKTMLFINWQKADYWTDYQFNSTTEMEWLNTSYPLYTTDIVKIYY